jgi:CHAT domain-containing protein/pimeloyl-ACP methyl ester carboxylesterase
MPKFTFYGTKTELVADSYQQLRSVQPNVQADEYTALSVRSAASAPVTIETADDDLVVMQLSNDVEWHYRADEFETFLKEQPGTRRGGADGELEVPSFFSSQEGTRGFSEVIKIKGLKVITGMVAKGAAQLLVTKMESTIDTGLHGLSEQFKFIPFDKKNAVKDKPYLLLIHGTNSNTGGAFGDLKTNDVYNRLFKFYEGRILAFEHKTLSESPLKNITDLLNALPDTMMVDVISHSRGGIVADLLARCSDGGLPFNADEIKIINANKDFDILKDEAALANAAALVKNIVVSKLVRVACPAAGTVLIDTRLDNLVNVFCNLLKLIPGAAACMPFTLFLDFAKAVVHERTDISVFPGVAAQIPGSALMRMLNNPNRKIKSELFVISGDVEHAGFLKSMLVISTNLYFGEAHDLVVNSNSMFKGTYRESIVKEHFEQESSVNHFNYFKNKKSQDALLAALTDTAQVDKLYHSLGATKDIKIEHKRGIAGKKPAVYVLPGIMGSHLEYVPKDQRLWLNYIGIATGVLTKLKINSNGIEATDLHAPSYAELINYLAADFDVYPFPYDWRMDLAAAADQLAEAITKELDNKDRINHEFHFIAHSMGGLVLRAMIHQHKDLWKRITGDKKTKVLMLGVPNEGSYGTIRILLGKDSVIKKLALLDFVHSKATLLDIFKEYPGVIQLLPKDATDIFTTNQWKRFEELNNEFTGVPSAATLKKGLDFYTAISDTDYDNEIFRYIAGQDDSTPESYTVVDGKIVFTSTSQGDGRVLWSTIPSTLAAQNIYYVAADHGSIPKFEPAFEGIKELLQKGRTDLAALSRTKPFARGAATMQVMPDSDVVTIPSETELNSNILSARESVKKTTSEAIINISVINGDLVHSKHPVVVGHFKGDGIVKAEKYLDRALDYKLSEYHLVNNYPGDIGTHLVILNDNIGVSEKMICKGGVVVGLGEFGTLTESRLLVSLTQGFLTLAIKYNELISNKPEAATADFGVSSLLVGSDFAGLRISASLKTILQAVTQANEKLDAMSKQEGVTKNYKKINHVEIVEIYQHKAIQIGRVIKSFLEVDGFSNFRFLPPVISLGSGALRVIADESLQDNWHRLEVSVIKKEAATAAELRQLPIRFTAITDKAHADEETLPGNRLIVDSLIQKIARHAQWNKVFSQTLYELLIPNEFKGYGASLHNMVLIVDEQTARYPWELLHDANGISDKPMVINTGIVRQLKSAEQRENIMMNNSSRALVIGNPITNGRFPDLPAAEKESLAVVNTFIANGLDTTPSIHEEDIDIVQKLLTKSYKIIHIASHGIAGKTVDDAAGVVIGKEIIFTAADFDRIRIVPEFVFINCCSSNEYDADVAEQVRRKYDLAASVGTQLIQMGVKAAIVTGWEIDDAAAELFSLTFYNAMFAGKSFGEAVRDAREITYHQFGQTNTWGAYQCYGDPFYTFMVSSAAAKKWKPSFVDVIEVIYELDNFISELASSSRRKGADEVEVRLEAIFNALQPNWKLDGRVLERLAIVYKIAGLNEKALEKYEQLFGLEKAIYTVSALEQYYGITARHVIEQLETGKITATKAKQKIHDAIKGLEKMNGNTNERYSLIASCYRRLYDIDDTGIEHLAKAAALYRKGYEHAAAAFNFIDCYPYFNWLHLSLLLTHEKLRDEALVLPANIEVLSTRALENAAQRDIAEPSFYNKTALSQYKLAVILSAANETVITKSVKDIISNFNAAWKRVGAANERSSIILYIGFIISLLKNLATNNKKLRDAKVKALENILSAISNP